MSKDMTTVSLQQINNEAKQESQFKIGDIVRINKHMTGLWSGLIGLEFCVVSNVVLPVWGIKLAARHFLDIEPAMLETFNNFISRDNTTRYYVISIPENCLEKLDKFSEPPYVNEKAWKTVLNDLEAQFWDDQRFWEEQHRKNPDAQTSAMLKLQPVETDINVIKSKNPMFDINNFPFEKLAKFIA